MSNLENDVYTRSNSENGEWRLMKPGKINYIADNISHGLSKKFVPGSHEEKTALLTQKEQTLFIIIPNKYKDDWIAKTFFKDELKINVNYDDFEKNKNIIFKDLLVKKNNWLKNLELNNKELLINIISITNNWYQTVKRLKELEKLKEPDQPTKTQSAGKKRKPRTKKSKKSKRSTLKKKIFL